MYEPTRVIDFSQRFFFFLMPYLVSMEPTVFAQKPLVSDSNNEVIGIEATTLQGRLQYYERSLNVLNLVNNAAFHSSSTFSSSLTYNKGAVSWCIVCLYIYYVHWLRSNKAQQASIGSICAPNMSCKWDGKSLICTNRICIVEQQQNSLATKHITPFVL